jgi:exopolyphosphatase/guanosine-5'-triphosphate,3'-diphosphate pyrophosphatase
MQPIRRAVIDVGTNSVKLLVADVVDREVRPVVEHSHQTRLGRGFYKEQRLQPEALRATARAMGQAVGMARQAGAKSLRVIATSAAREAVNREELSTIVEAATGVTMEVISGEQEAEWGFRGVTSNPDLAQMPLLLLDVGGGSTQCVFGRAGQRLFSHSLPLGSVRLLETLPCSDPPQPSELASCRQWLREFLRREVRPRLAEEMQWEGERPREPKHLLNSEGIGQHALASVATGAGREVQLVGVGGAASILGCMEAGLVAFDRTRIEATRLSAARVAWHLERLWSLPLAERKGIIGLPKNRADVILMGVAIYQAVMEEFGFAELRISTRGLRFAALMED